MMDDRLSEAKKLLSDKASLQIHIDENEYENLDLLLRSYPLFNAGTVVWDKRNPMNSRTGIATQHEYLLWRTTSNQMIESKLVTQKKF
jgi:adenine-specific DNA-methyltransferase